MFYDFDDFVNYIVTGHSEVFGGFIVSLDECIMDVNIHRSAIA